MLGAQYNGHPIHRKLHNFSWKIGNVQGLYHAKLLCTIYHRGTWYKWVTCSTKFQFIIGDKKQKRKKLSEYF